MAEKRYWLFKSEPTAYSYADLQGEADGFAEWDGVRNYQARNLMRDEMKTGDGILFYHSSADPMAVVDQYGRVHGVEGLRVVDASIMPNCIRGNTNVTTMMIGEHVSDFIKQGK